MSGKLSGRGRPRRGPCNTWDEEQRTVLHVLCSHFQFPAVLRARIFNALFKDHLARCGLPDGLQSKVLGIQYYESNKKPHIWNAICAPPATDEERRQRSELTKRIQNVAESLGARMQSSRARTTSNAPQVAPYLNERADATPRTSPKRLAGFVLSEPSNKKRKLRSVSDDAVLRSSATRDDADLGDMILTDLTFTGHDFSKTTPTIRTVVSVRVNDNGEGSSRVPPRQPFTPSSSRSRKVGKASTETVQYVRRIGPTLNLTPQQIALAEGPLTAVPEALAHPPAPGLLYRYWDENSFGMNSETEFIAGRFMYNNISPRSPKCSGPDYADIENHLMMTETASPFCSAANCFLWIMRLALKKLGNGATHGVITLIDADALPRRGFYHVKPFFDQLKKKFCFLSGHWKYSGFHEFLIWHQVPQHAIVHTFKIADLLAACQRLPALAAALRVQKVGRRADLKTTIVSDLRSGQVSLSRETVTVLAQLCRFVGLSGASPLKQLEHLVGDVIQGWRLNVEARSSSGWASYATLWSHVLCGRSTVPSLERALQLRMTFLHGVKAGLGEFNTLHNPELIAKARPDPGPLFGHQANALQMQSKAREVGLESPSKIMFKSIASAKGAVIACETEQDARYAEAANTTRLLPGFEDSFRLESDVEQASDNTVENGSDIDEDGITYDDEVLGL